MVRFKIVRLGTDYQGKITDFAAARNSFLETLADDEYILFLDNDEEAPQKLLEACRNATTAHPFYRIHRMTLDNGRLWKVPDYVDRLVSNRVRYEGRIHEGIRTNGGGRIDFPIIHDRSGSRWYDSEADRFRLRRVHGIAVPDRLVNILVAFNTIKWMMQD
jgi:hypothetical protein